MHAKLVTCAHIDALMPNSRSSLCIFFILLQSTSINRAVYGVWPHRFLSQQLMHEDVAKHRPMSSNLVQSSPEKRQCGPRLTSDDVIRSGQTM